MPLHGERGCRKSITDMALRLDHGSGRRGGRTNLGLDDVKPIWFYTVVTIR
jgi:hypothetical protein